MPLTSVICREPISQLARSEVGASRFGSRRRGRRPWMRIALAALLMAAPGVARGEPIAFVVAEIPGREVQGDSYVLILEDPDDVGYARDLIRQGAGVAGTIVVARIAAGTDGVNRDVLAPGEPEWSWHITTFEGFAEITAEILDGTPSLVNADVSGWIEASGGSIGFWEYTVVSEIPEPTSELSGVATLAVLAALARRRAHRGLRAAAPGAPQPARPIADVSDRSCPAIPAFVDGGTRSPRASRQAGALRRRSADVATSRRATPCARAAAPANAGNGRRRPWCRRPSRRPRSARSL